MSSHRAAIFFAMIFLVSACNVGSNQLSNLQSINNDRGNEASTEGFLWSAILGAGEASEVVPIEVQGHTAFANRAGWIIRFNGWEFFEINVPDQSVAIEISFSIEDVVTQGTHPSQMRCEPWSNTEIETGVRHHRLCMVAGVTYESFLIVSSLGETIEIHQYISEAFGYLNLTKL